MNIDSSAPVIVSEEVLVLSSPARVWALLTAIDQWPEWNPDITAAALKGPVAVGSTFQWATAGLAIVSTLGEVIPGKRLAWSGDTNGIFGIHVWTLEPADAKGESTRVRTAESWSGDAVQQAPAMMEGLLRSAITAWLGHLRSTAEQHGARTAA
ncbi:Shy6-polyketide cyclase [Pyxidicoccus fallax]|uniref:Shy6-polyketide cyclase n=1 Tax=Pyxidicoccus fallax TaxID=394095 RepID=A0A848L7F7_9BACT|nr:SRPBCC family protein [Pyxidicoccus fallax]NMO14202.1 Shy6-polyketide cyclase [Pyxidicoccus fallax]NPC82203.1 Shy6-polyketide cyclase [Pyxidicoccus fallax]